MDYTGSTYEEIESEIDKLLEVNGDDLDAEAIRNTKIFTKISRIYIQKSRQLGKLLDQQKQIEHVRKRHYSGKLTSEHYKKEPLNEAILKADIPEYMDIDPLVVEMRNQVKECERIVKFLEDSKKTLYSRGFDIKNAIDYRKMMLGG